MGAQGWKETEPIISIVSLCPLRRAGFAAVTDAAVWQKTAGSLLLVSIKIERIVESFGERELLRV